jgi:dynein heavy chain
VLTQIVFDIAEIKSQCDKRLDLDFRKYNRHPKKDQLWDQKAKTQVEKVAEKRPLRDIERNLSIYKELISEFKNDPPEKIADFILIDFRNVIHTFVVTAEDWLQRYAEVLKKRGETKLAEIEVKIDQYRVEIQKEPQEIDSLKSLLNEISKIKNQTMEMEFNISDVTEIFRILKMYSPEHKARFDDAFALEEKWNQLLLEAKVKDEKLLLTKKMFAKETKDKVDMFKTKVDALHHRFKGSGPGSQETSLD